VCGHPFMTVEYKFLRTLAGSFDNTEFSSLSQLFGSVPYGLLRSAAMLKYRCGVGIAHVCR
jgi:hypothetical protein